MSLSKKRVHIEGNAERKADKLTLGHDNSIYRKKEGSNGKWISCSSNDTDPTKTIDSLIERFLRNGNVFNATPRDKRQRLADSTQFVRDSNTTHDGNRDLYQNKSHLQAVRVMSVTENFWKEQAAGSDHGKMLQKLRELGDGTLNDDDAPVQFRAMEAIHCIAYVEYVTGGKESIQSLGGATGRGASYPTVATLATAINNVHTKIGMVESPFETDQSLKKRLAKMRKEHAPHGAESFDYATDLEPLYEANFTDNSKSYLEKIRDWLTILLMVVLILRASEVCCEFVPVMESVSHPQQAEGWGSDNIPSVLMLKLHDWKGKKADEDPLTLNLHRNSVDQRFCPVFYMLLWTKLSGIRQGPIITDLPGGIGKQIVPQPHRQIEMNFSGGCRKVWVTEKGGMVGMKWSMMERMLMKVCSRAGFPQARTHSFRKSSAKWAARCGASDSVIMATGRWKTNSNHFSKYMQEGRNEAQKYLSLGKPDPIRKVLVFKPSLYYVTMARQLDSLP